jgi:methionyl aminopeptidase
MIAQRIPIKTRSEIEKMRQSGRHVAEILLLLRERAKSGTTTGALNDMARAEIDKRGVESSFLGYGPGGLPPYPAVLCVSVNDEIVHGIPGKRELRDGDLLSLDFGITADGFHGDSACTIPVGEVDDDALELMETTRQSLYDAIDQMQPGKRLSDIGHAVQTRAESRGYGVVRQFVGHGIGRVMHELPQIPNYGRPGRGPRLLPGMVFAIEPMVNIGSESVKMLEDEWTAVTEDGELSAHFEHTVLISDNGPEILTRVEGSH